MGKRGYSPKLAVEYFYYARHRTALMVKALLSLGRVGPLLIWAAYSHHELVDHGLPAAKTHRSKTNNEKRLHRLYDRLDTKNPT